MQKLPSNKLLFAHLGYFWLVMTRLSSAETFLEELVLQGAEKLVCASVCSAAGILPRLQVHLSLALQALFG